MKHKKRKAPAIVAFGDKLSSVETETRYQNPKAKIFDIIHFPYRLLQNSLAEKHHREKVNKKKGCIVFSLTRNNERQSEAL